MKVLATCWKCDNQRFKIFGTQFFYVKPCAITTNRTLIILRNTDPLYSTVCNQCLTSLNCALFFNKHGQARWNGWKHRTVYEEIEILVSDVKGIMDVIKEEK